MNICHCVQQCNKYLGHSVYMSYKKIKIDGKKVKKILSISFNGVDLLDLEDIELSPEIFSLAIFDKMHRGRKSALVNQMIIPIVCDEVKRQIIELFKFKNDASKLLYKNDDSEVYENDIINILQKYGKGLYKYRLINDKDEKLSDWKVV